MKKFLWFLSTVSILVLASCGGGGSSKEAKALLQKILQFVGIPQEIVVNVCQDSNKDGICGNGELFTKVIINKDDDINDILRKISLTPDGKYFLETYNPELPILVELQNEAKVNFDNGKFTLNFNGFKTNEDNETKEISILESMVDANALTKNIADRFRTLNNTEAQDKYYVALLDSLEKNINTLRSNDFDSRVAVSLAIKEMGNKTTINQEQANRINNCENNQTCVDNEIKKVSEELVISYEEVVKIKNAENTNSTPIPIANGEPEKNSGFTKEILQDKVLYHYAYTEEDGSKGYGKMTIVSETLWKRREVRITKDGKFDSEENFDVSYVIEDGKIKSDAGSDYRYLILNSQKSNGWSVTEEIDRGKDGTIDKIEDDFMYFEKPSNYPAEL